MSKGILFSGGMVRAILDGRKTVTRRPVKPKKNSRCRMTIFNSIMKLSNGWFGVDFSGMPFVNDLIEQPPCKVGDILYVRETWNLVPTVGHIDEPFARYVYRADKRLKNDFPWRPSIHMPREAARLFLRVTGVRVERLREITAADVEREGIPPHTTFVELWDSVYANRGYGWQQNPFVWVIEFERAENRG